ncbi:MAG: hypothetical protein R2807_03350 [Chitinophagales bacterium]
MPNLLLSMVVLDAVSPIVLAIPFLALVVVLAAGIFTVIYVISYVKKKNKKNNDVGNITS